MSFRFTHKSAPFYPFGIWERSIFRSEESSIASSMHKVFVVWKIKILERWRYRKFGESWATLSIAVFFLRRDGGTRDIFGISLESREFRSPLYNNKREIRDIWDLTKLEWNYSEIYDLCVKTLELPELIYSD